MKIKDGLVVPDDYYDELDGDEEEKESAKVKITIVDEGDGDEQC